MKFTNAAADALWKTFQSPYLRAVIVVLVCAWQGEDGGDGESWIGHVLADQ